MSSDAWVHYLNKGLYMLRLKSNEYVSSPSNIRVLSRNPQQDYPEHGHDFSELILVTSGSGMHIVNGSQSVVFPNMIACVSEHDYHQYAENKDVTLLNILYDKQQLNISSMAADAVKRLEGEASNRLVTSESFSPLLSIAERIKAEQESGDKHAEQMIKLLFEQLLLYIDRIDVASINHSPVMNAIIFLCNNYSEQELSVSKVCDTFSITAKALNSQLTYLTGMSANRFINHLRMRRAISLLKNGYTVTEAAYLVGYSDSNYFSTKFKATTGVPPKDYQKPAG